MKSPEANYQVIVTKGNPSRGWGYEIAHFTENSGVLQNLPEKDCFMPNMQAAIRWVRNHYRCVRRIRSHKNRMGKVAAICFSCSDSK